MSNQIPSISFNCIILIQSLEPNEQYTTKALQESITGNAAFAEDPIPIHTYHVNNAIEFQVLIQKLTQSAKEGLKPIINVDCHGDAIEGLEFENGSTLSWKELTECLLPLNEATRFNLIAIFSACYGAYFLQNMGVIRPAPCAFILATTDEIDPSELMSGLRVFYNALFETLDMGEVIKRVYSQGLQKGLWFAELAETWYLDAVTAYVRKHCTLKESRKKVEQAFVKLKTNGFVKTKNTNLGRKLKQELQKNHNQNFTNKYFEIFFMLDLVPENQQRFRPLKDIINIRLNELRKTGKYLL